MVRGGQFILKKNLEARSYIFITAVETTEKQVLFWEMKSMPGHDTSMLTGYA
jgi:hypothetical protein